MVATVTNHLLQEYANMLMNDFLGSQIFHIVFYVYKVNRYLKPLIFHHSLIKMTDTSEYKLQSLGLSESKKLAKVYSFYILIVIL